MSIVSFFRIDNTVFEVLGYPMSYIELIGTLLYLWSVWLIGKRNILTWPVGILSVLLYMALFYQIRLYSDAMEQVYYLFVCSLGWWRWSRSEKVDGKVIGLRFNSRQGLLLALGLTLLLSAAHGYLMRHVHLFLPELFPEPAAFPFLDALTTIMSFTAMWLMAKKRIESWIYWIVVDILGIGIYFIKHVWFVSLLYVILLFLAVKGLLMWIRAKDRST